MASASTTADSLVTLKVNYNGTTRRYKLPLRDMGASTLEDKIRSLLEIAQGTDCLIERYSDSAGTYVVLDPANVSVYKQLYRAAKAKSKLKLRVTRLGQAEEERQVPRPVTVEDVPEPADGRLASSTEEEQPTEPLPKAKPKPFMGTFRPRPYRTEVVQDFEQCLAALVKQSEKLDLNFTGHNGAPQAQAAAPTTSKSSEKVIDAACDDKVDCADPAPVASDCITTSSAFGFRVCCNSCEQTIPDAHYHCTKCDEDDFDLCQSCVDKGITCYDADHWLIRRFKKDGVYISSTTETIPPKPKAKEASPVAAVPSFSLCRPPICRAPIPLTRTCNSCVTELPDSEFLHCTSCEDFDLCKKCFGKNKHGHHPKHGFVPVDGVIVADHVAAMLAPGRNQSHHAICDGCDKFIHGVRHKCLDCPDWDYCADCIVNASFVHPNHRFVPVYEPLAEHQYTRKVRAIHIGVCCDGPLCSVRAASEAFITGDRYKCAVCHNTDFCANCEASPANTHNKTHPLIKFKTPVRHVSVSTLGEHGDGTQMHPMGDRVWSARYRPNTAARSSAVSINSVQTVVDVEPSEPTPVKAEDPVLEAQTKGEPEAQKDVEIKETQEDMEIKEEDQAVAAASSPAAEMVPTTSDLVAVYIRDTVTDGTVLPPNHVFEQTWVLRNSGNVAWPAGCSVKFVGGDYMGHVDSSHPAGISELVSASESTVCYEPLAPGDEFPFTALLRTPAREGKIISYWRLTTKEGIKFGHRLWCDVSVQDPKAKEEPKAAPEALKQEPVMEEVLAAMIFPKLEKESPVSSVHVEAAPQVPDANLEAEVDDFEDCEDDEWDGSDGFLTDEEYDILDASDEEYLEQQHKKLIKK